MRRIASLLVLALTAKVALAGAIGDQFSSGYGGVPWGMTLSSLVGLTTRHTDWIIRRLRADC